MCFLPQIKLIVFIRFAIHISISISSVGRFDLSDADVKACHSKPEMYEAEIFRNLINHENELRDHRTNWFLTAQGFVFAASSYSAAESNYLWLMGAAIIGFFVTFILSKGVIVTTLAIVKLEREFNHRQPQYSGPPIIGLHMTNDWKEGLIYESEYLLPLLFFLVWFIVLVASGIKIGGFELGLSMMVVGLVLLVIFLEKVKQKLCAWGDDLVNQGNI